MYNVRKREWARRSVLLGRKCARLCLAVDIKRLGYLQTQDGVVSSSPLYKSIHSREKKNVFRAITMTPSVCVSSKPMKNVRHENKFEARDVLVNERF